MTASGLTSGQQALAEAARLEAALVYGRVVHEHKNAPSGLAALVAEAELAARAQRVDKRKRPVRKPATRPEPQTPGEWSEEAHALADMTDQATIGALRAGMTIRQVMDAWGIDYAEARALKRRQQEAS